MSQAKPLTTGQVAAICRASPHMVITWIDSGILPAWRIPGSSHRRIDRSELAAFMARHGMPAEWAEEVRGAA